MRQKFDRLRWMLGPALLLSLSGAWAAENEPLPTVEQAVAALESRRGLLTIHIDAERGRVFLELPGTSHPRGEVGRYLYVEGLVGGLGSNPVGLDRGQLGPARVVALRNVGGKVLVEQVNLGFRALNADALERRAVEQSFATSVLWGAEWVARSADGRVLVDFTSFLVRDAHGVANTLAETEQGNWTLDEKRSVLDLENCLAFPKNLEFEATLTWAGKQPGAHVSRVSPDPRSITLVQHHSLLALPPGGYQTREFDPRAGSFAVSFHDYAAPLSQPLTRRWIVRHRLEKVDPRAPSSRVKEPIVYYVDSGAPQPIRDALIEGASWWTAAFEAAGFVDAFRVEPLPLEAHPLDARYNVIEWVHRSTRGWSYGGGVVDPRTGEMVKGHVSLGSLRVRQDRLLFESLVGTEATGTGGPDDPIQLALARLRQLSAHEVGHTLGLNHNFAASTYGRASVMDYPAPLIRVGAEGVLDTSEAYGVGVGAWDVHAIRYAYSQFPVGVEEGAELLRIIEDGLQKGYRFLSDQDARPAGAAHPMANLWDNGSDPLAEFERSLRVRRVGLDAFGPTRVTLGTPLALLQERLATLYFYHRYQLKAAAKLVGGLNYTYAVRGDGQSGVRVVDAERQRRAIGRLLAALVPAELDLSEATLALLLPRPPGYWGNRELFQGRTAPAFDALGAAGTAARLVVDELLQPQRCARMVDLHRRDPTMPGLKELLDQLVESQFVRLSALSERQQAIRERVQDVVLEGLQGLAGLETATPEVRLQVETTLAELGERLRGQGGPANIRRAAGIELFLERAYAARTFGSLTDAPPPGSPIGQLPPDLSGCSLETLAFDELR